MADYNIELINDTSYTINLNEQGPQGATGPRGPQGEQGLQGVKGDKGDTATIEVGDTETLPAKTNAFVMNTGTKEEAVLEFGIPKGYSPTIEEDVNTETEYRLKVTNEDNEFVTPNLRSQAYIPYATQEEAIAGEREDVVISPATAKDVAYNYIGKITQLGFNGTLESNTVTFVPDTATPYDIKEGYEYEIDLLFPAAGVLPDTTKLVIENNGEAINLVNVKHSDSTQAIEYGDMKQVCRYDNEIGWRWIFNARFAITDAGNKVFVIPSTVTDTPSNVVTTDTNQNITGAKNFINSATSTTPDAHTSMSITLKNDQAELGGDSTNADGTVNFKYNGVRFVDKNNEEISSLYSAPDGVGGSFTRLNASAKVDGEYVDGFVELEVDANGKTHFYVPEVDEDSTVNGTQAATVDFVKSHAGGLEIGTIVTTPFGVDESENKYRYLNGQVLIQSQFPSFTAKVKSWQATRANLFTTEDNWQAEKTTSKLGQCGRFVVDDSAGTIRLPLVININGLTDLANCGVLRNESLPNITGTKVSDCGDANTDDTGALYTTNARTNSWWSGATNVTRRYDLNFDASRSSSTYQNNAPVQQEAIQYPYVIVVNTGVEEAERPINNYQVNNVYAYGMSQYYKGTMANSSWLRSAGQWNSGTVYNGIYNWILENVNNKVDGFKTTDSRYTDYDFVIDLENELLEGPRFRLPIKNGQEGVFADKVKGNGLCVGFTNGVLNLGISAVNEEERPRMTSAASFYGAATGSTVYSNAPMDIRGFGLTTDSSKSGIVVDLTVPDGYNLYYYIGDVLQNTDLINIARLGEELVDIKSTPHIEETYVNGTSGYRIWSKDSTGYRYCEQWGRIPYEGAEGNYTVNLLKTMANADYTCQITLFAGTTRYDNTIVGRYYQAWNLSTTSFTAYKWSAQAIQQMWKVCGYLAD